MVHPKSRFERFSDWAAKLSKRIGAFAIAGTIVGFWFTYQDRIDARHEHAWATLREALKWSAESRWGNVGHVSAIEALTGSCDSWWKGTFFEPIVAAFIRDCEPLNSLFLKGMELGELNASGSNLSNSNLSCSNLTNAKLKRANLQRVDLSASILAGADLRGADLRDNKGFVLVDVSGAKMDEDTKIDDETLKCACVNLITDGHGNLVRRGIETSVSRLKSISDKLYVCPGGVVNKCQDDVQKPWVCVQ